MARGRIIDKALFSNYQVKRLSLPAKFLYIGTIVFADDEGRFRAEPRLLSSLCHPYGSSKGGLTVSDQLSEIVKSKLIVIYKVDGQQYGYHPNWLKWQPLRKDRIKASDCPPPPNWQPNDNQASTNCPQIGSITGTGTGTITGRKDNNIYIPPSTSDFSNQKPPLKDLFFHKIFSAITTAQKAKYLERYPEEFLYDTLTRYIDTAKDKKISAMKASTVREFLEKDFREYQKANGEPERKRREREQAEREKAERERIEKESRPGKSLKQMFDETMESKKGKSKK